MVLSKHGPISFSCFFLSMCNTSCANRSDQCALVKSLYIPLACFPVWSIFPVLARGMEARKGKKKISLQLTFPLLEDMSAGGGLSSQEPLFPGVCRCVAERASKGDLGGQLQCPCHHKEMWSLERKEADCHLRCILEKCSQERPTGHVLSVVGQATPEICVLETWYFASVWRLRQCLHHDYHSFVAALSSNRKTIQRTGHLLAHWQIWGGLRSPGQPLSPLLYSRHPQ